MDQMITSSDDEEDLTGISPFKIRPSKLLVALLSFCYPLYCPLTIKCDWLSGADLRYSVFDQMRPKNVHKKSAPADMYDESDGDDSDDNDDRFDEGNKR